MSEKKQYSDEELMARVWDQEEIRNLIGRYTWMEAANQREQALAQCWVQQPEHQATASFGRNWGFLVGMEEIRSYYVGRDRFGAAGTALMHPLSTKLVCQAEDGKTAQGIWMGIAYEMAPDSQGELDAKWINERVAVDFLKEDGKWKIWHLFIGTNYVFSAGESYREQPLNTRTVTREEGAPDWYVVGDGREKTQGIVAEFDQIPDYPEREVFLNGRAPQQVYTALYNDPITFPPLPVEYRSYDPTMGYGPEGFQRFAKSRKGRV
jgi:hypothetical protein